MEYYSLCVLTEFIKFYFYDNDLSAMTSFAYDAVIKYF